MSSITALIYNFQTDWSKCCLCQAEKKGEELKTPPIHYSCSSDNDGYKMLAMNVPPFHEINQLPIIFDPKRLDEGDGIEQTLRKNKAQYHQSCRLLFNTKLERAGKRTASTRILQRKYRLRCVERLLETRMCFLCEEESPSADLRQAMTMQLDKILNECVRNLNDSKL